MVSIHSNRNSKISILKLDKLSREINKRDQKEEKHQRLTRLHIESHKNTNLIVMVYMAECLL